MTQSTQWGKQKQTPPQTQQIRAKTITNSRKQINERCKVNITENK